MLMLCCALSTPPCLAIPETYLYPSITTYPSRGRPGGLNVTAKKRILGALLLSFEYDDSNTSSSSDIMESLCDINVLLAIDVLIRREDTADLCSLMKKYVRGKRRGTVVVTILRAVLRSVLEGI